MDCCDNLGKVINCFNRAGITGNHSKGRSLTAGVVGGNTSSFIDLCYNTGTISNTSSGTKHTGGVSGYNNGTITNCYFLSGTSSAGIGSGTTTGTTTGTTAMTDANMKLETFVNALNSLRQEGYLEWVSVLDSYPEHARDNIEISIDSNAKTININTANCTEQIKEVKYIYGTRDVNILKNSGEIVNISNNIGTVNNIENGIYSFIFITNENKEIIKTKAVEGLDTISTHKINNETLSFKRIVTIGENGECKTLKEGFDYLLNNGYKTNGALLLKEGTYSLHELCTGTSYNIDSKYNQMNISIIADSPGSTYIDPGETTILENNINYYITFKFYQIIFTENVYGNGVSLASDTYTDEYYNCVFLCPTGGYTGYKNTAAVNLYNCLFTGGANTYYTSHPAKGLAQNCASTTTIMDPYSGTKTTCLTNVAVDENYNITTEGWKNTGTGTNPDGSQAHIGVYGGKYAW